MKHTTLHNKTAVVMLACMMSIRMLGLFMILPVFSVAAASLAGATPKLIGITLGIYGLTQALFQIPLGLLSDHIGRKRVIFAGLSIFLIGSVLGANAHSIYLMMIARALQGAGAIGSTILAFVSDITAPESRTKAMAFIGMSIGCAFTIAMILGPVINHYFYLSGIFWVTALLAIIAMIFITALPAPSHHVHITHQNYLNPLLNKKLVALDVGIFSLHTILTAMFIAIPILLAQQLHLSNPQQMILYGVILLMGFACAVPLIVTAEKKGKIRSIFLTAVASIFLVECLFYADVRLMPHLELFTLLLVFFTAFTALEALLPSMVSKTVSAQKKGAAMGIYSTAQFMGIFVGGALGGIAYANTGFKGVFALCAVISAAWYLTHQRLSKDINPLKKP
jgi:predicted MFS family arabinose efflux permease